MPSSDAATYFDRFSRYFAREVAIQAAEPLRVGAEIELRLLNRERQELAVFTFTKTSQAAQLLQGAAKDPQVGFLIPEAAADQILDAPAEDIGSIAVEVGKLIFHSEASHKIGLEVYAGFWTLFKKGYFGVIKSGGKAFTGFLSTRGLNGIDGVKAALKRIKP